MWKRPVILAEKVREALRFLKPALQSALPRKVATLSHSRSDLDADRDQVDLQLFESRAESWRQKGANIGRNVRLIGVLDAVNPHLVRIGDNTVLGSQAAILTHGPTKSAETSVGNNVYIGFGAIVLPGVTIGDNCIIGAGSVVTRDVPVNSISAGNPARVLRQRDPQELANYVQAMEEGRAIGAVRLQD